MPVIGCRYTQVQFEPNGAHPEGLRVARPWLIARIAAHGQAPLTCRVCLDTGADYCVFPLTFAHLLGLNVADMPESVTSGVTGKGTVYHAPVRVVIPFGEIGPKPAVDISFDVMAGFTEGLDAQGIGLLGQSGFFDRYKVIFNQKRGIFTISTD